MSVLRSFAATGWFEIRGRGWVANVAGIPGFDPRPLVGQQVEIAGKPYTVKGVETHCVMDATGQNFELLVGER